MIKPVVINDKKEVIEGSILFSKSNSFIEALNNREDDINLIYNGSIKIKKIIVRCTRDVYDRIK